MKNQILLILTVFSFAQLSAQIVNIPDASFKNMLLSAASNTNTATDSNGDFVSIDLNNNGEIEVSEAENILELRLPSGNITDLTGIEAFINLELLICAGNDLTSLDLSQNVNLITLACQGNAIQALDLSQNVNLELLYCFSNGLTSLNLTQNINLKELGCNWNDLTSLDLSQNINLEDLTCHSNQLTSLDLSNNTQLKDLYCASNPLGSLDLTQNINLESVNCNNNQLTNLVIGQNINLFELDCNNNQLTDVDISQLPNLLDYRCRNNNLTEIDVTQNLNLFRLDFTDNQLSAIDLSNNNNLETLFCLDNQLTELDLSQTKVDQWNVSNNQIAYINVKNGLDSGAGSFNNNPVEFICADQDEVSLYQVLSGFQANVNTYCTFEPGGDYNTITGSITFDSNNNSTCDASDTPIPFILMNITNGFENGYTYANTAGEYFIYPQEGTYGVSPIVENPTWFNITPPQAFIPFFSLNNTIAQDFCITANGVHNDLEIVISPLVPAQPGFDAIYQIVYKNKGNQTLSGSIDFTYDDSVLDLLSTSVIPDAQSSGNLSWNYSNLNPFESREIVVVLNVNSPMETPAVNIGDELDFTANISPTASDEIPDDNQFNYKQVVIGSFDPNDITCLEGEVLSPDRIGEFLHYNIRFENTGTAAATFVVIKDVINETFYDLSTLQVINASHNMVTRIENNTVEFFFDNINLGPSEMGNVLFKIKTNNSLVVGDSVSNSAEIFFDFNFPIETNIAETIFQVLSVDEFSQNSVQIFPNPVNNVLRIKSEKPMDALRIYDIQGRLMLNENVQSLDLSVDVSSYLAGIYFIELQAAGSTETFRVIKN